MERAKSVVNPWIQLREVEPFVSPEDQLVIESFNKSLPSGSIHRLRVETILPEAFVGPADAPVLLLSNNPGYKDEESLAKRNHTGFMEKLRANLLHKPLPTPFLFLENEFIERTGNRWWQSKLKCLIQRFGVEDVARTVMNVVYFPYPSYRYKHWSKPLASQQYSFHLVSEAMKRNAVIIHMRTGRMPDWRAHVRGLSGYNREFCVKNPQSPSISPRNCPKGYPEAVKAIELFLSKKS